VAIATASTVYGLTGVCLIAGGLLIGRRSRLEIPATVKY